MRSVLSCLLSLGLVACSGVGGGSTPGSRSDAEATARYTYPGCPDEDDGCSGLAALDCALTGLRSKHTACGTDADCVAVQLADDCSGFSACGVAVRREEAATFTTEAGAEVARYCAQSTKCVRSPMCVPTAPVCRNGQCTMAMTGPDAGT